MASENRLLAMICRRLKSATKGFKVTEWQIEKLSNMGGLNRDAVAEISKTSKKANVLLGKVLSEVAKKSLSIDGVDTKETQGVLQTIQALQTQAKSHLNIVNTTMLAGVQNQYGNIIQRLDAERNVILNDATMDLVTGQKTFTEAVGYAVRDLADAGINAFVDKAGREWSPEGMYQWTCGLHLHRPQERLSKHKAGTMGWMLYSFPHTQGQDPSANRTKEDAIP